MNPFTALTSKIFGGLALILSVALTVQTVRVNNLSDKLEASELKLEISNNSIDLLQEALGASRKSIEEAKTVRDKAIANSQAALAVAKGQTKTLRSQADSILKADTSGDGNCPTDKGILNAKGL